MKILLLSLLLTSCIVPSYHSPKPGTCLKFRDYGKFVIKKLYDNTYLTMQFDYYSSKKDLYGLGEDYFNKKVYRYVDCPKLEYISIDAEKELKNRKEWKEFLTLIQENNEKNPR